MRLINKLRPIRPGLVMVCALVSMSPAFAQDAPTSAEEQAQQAVTLRQSLFHLIGYSFSPVGAMLKNKRPFDAAVAQKSSARLEQLAPMISEVFQTDTRKFSVKTKARDDIWTDKADFVAKNNDLVKTLTGLSAAAKSGDKKTFTQAATAVGKACSACHDSFYKDK